MGFFEKARTSGAMEYGRARAEQYGRLAKLWLAIKVAFWSALIILIIIVTLTHRGG